MTVLRGATAPVFESDHVTAVGLTAPSRGAKQTCAWRFRMSPAAPAAPHRVDREEIFVLISGRAVAELEGERHELSAGDALIVPPDTTFSVSNPHAEPLEMVAVLPVGGRAVMPGMDPFVPPWAR
ncbi:cupin domain-containing protein [Nocardia thraciensis]